MKKLKLVLMTVLVGALFALAVVVQAQAPKGVNRAQGVQSATTKSLSTNMTLMNLSAITDAHVVADYRLNDGNEWPNVGDNNSQTSFTIPKNGGQSYQAHYFSSMDSGRGSVVISSDQPLAAVVQEQARAPQVPSFGAYSGITQPSEKYYIPFLPKQLATASGVGNGVIIIQNTEDTPTNVTVDFVSGATFAVVYTANINNIPAGSSYYYDLSDETNLPDNFYGSAVVSAQSGKQIAVLTNIFLGSDGLLADNAFPQESLTDEWVIPIFDSRLANGLNTGVSVQNLSGSEMAAGSIQLQCTQGDGSPAPASLTVSNDVSIANNGTAAFNPVVDMVNFPDAWYGSCRVTAPGNVVVSIQQRIIGQSLMDGFGGIPANGTDKTVLIPSVAKRLSNGYATAFFVQNLSATLPTSVTVTYTPSPLYVAGGGSSATIDVGPLNLAAGASLYQNHRISSGAGSVASLPDGWYGTATVTSSNQPINGIAQLTFLTGYGDNLQAHNLFTK